MKNTMKIGVVIVLSALIIALPFIGSTDKENKAISKQQSKIHSLPVMYNTAEGLVENSDLIVQGTVKEVSGGYLKPINNTGDKKMNLIFFKNVIEIKEILKGNVENQSSIIANKRIGFQIEDERFIEDEIAPYSKGEEVILFLKARNGEFYPISPYQDKVEVKAKNENENMAFRQMGQDPNIFSMFKDLTVNQIKKKIKNIVKK